MKTIEYFRKYNSPQFGVLVTFICCFLFSFLGFSQSIQQIEKRAEAAFKNKNYATARVDFQQLLAREPASLNYNLKYGICLFHSEQRLESKKYFEYVSKQSNPPCEIYYYLGKNAQFAYSFEKAIQHFNRYNSCNPNEQNFPINSEITKCSNGLKLLDNPKSLFVLSKNISNEASFTQKYDFEKMGGDVFTDIALQSKIDKKNNHVPQYYFRRGQKYKFYSSYGSNVNHKDIYFITKVNSDTWSQPKKLPTALNSTADEDFPFYDEKNNVIYFSSNGQNSMGGYDLFSASFDPESLNLGPISNLDFPYSSAFDDYFFIPEDSLCTTAYLASNRSVGKGKVEVFHVEFSKKPSALIVINGNFQDHVDLKNREMQILATDALDGTVYGPFSTDSEGKYTMILPGSGEFIFEISVAGSSMKFIDRKKIPIQKQNVVFRQNIQYSVVETNQFAKFTYDFSGGMNDELRSIKINALAGLQSNPRKMENIGLKAVPSEEKEIVTFLKDEGFTQENIVKQSEALSDKLLDFSSSGDNMKEDILLMNERKVGIENQMNSILKHIESLKGQIINEKNPYLANQLKEETAALYDSLRNIASTLMAFKELLEIANANLKQWTDLNIENSTEKISDQIKLYVLLENEDSLQKVIQENFKEIQEALLIEKEQALSKNEINDHSDEMVAVQLEISNLEKQHSELLRRKNELTAGIPKASKDEKLKIEKQLVALEKEIQSNEILIASNQTQLNEIKVLDLVSHKKSEIENKLSISYPLFEIENPKSIEQTQNMERAVTWEEEKIKLQNEINSKKEYSQAALKQQEDSKEKFTNLSLVLSNEVNQLKSALETANEVDKELIAEKLQRLESEIEFINNKLEAYSNQETASVSVEPDPKLENPLKNENTAVVQNDPNVVPEIVPTNPFAEGDPNLENPLKNENTAVVQNDPNVVPETVPTNPVIEPDPNLENPLKNENTAVVQNDPNVVPEVIPTNPDIEPIPNLENPLKNENTAMVQNDPNVVPEIVPTNPVIEPVPNLENPLKNENTAVVQNDPKVVPEIVPTNPVIEPDPNLENPLKNENTAVVQNDPNVVPEIVPTNPDIEPIPNIENSSTNIEKIANQNLSKYLEQETEQRIEVISEMTNASKDSIETEKITTLSNQIQFEKEINTFLSTVPKDVSNIIVSPEERMNWNENQRLILNDLNESQSTKEYSSQLNHQLKILEMISVPNKNKTEFSQSTLSPSEMESLSFMEMYDQYITDRKNLVELETELMNAQRILDESKIEFYSEISKNNNSNETKISSQLQQELLENATRLLEAQEKYNVALTNILNQKNAGNFAAMVENGILPKQISKKPEKQLEEMSFSIVESEGSMETTPFPVTNVQPKGLIFRVQVGAFRKTVPTYFFREFTPVTGEKIENDLTAYMAGFFVNSQSAILARTSIRDLGYKDAYLVAYCDGKRMSFQEGLLLEKNGGCVQRNQQELAAEVLQIYNSSLGNQTSRVEVPKEVYYTVQVASIIKPIQANQLNGIPELIEHKSDNGMYKYSSGKFEDLNVAKERRKQVQLLGIKDAFIVAYRDGIKISVNEANIALNYIKNKPKENESITNFTTPKNSDLQKIEIGQEAQKTFIKLSKDGLNFNRELMASLNRMMPFAYDSISKDFNSTWMELSAVSPLEWIHYSDTKVEKQNPIKIQYVIIGSGAAALNPVLHDFALHGSIPYAPFVEKKESFLKFDIIDSNQISLLKEFANKNNLTIEVQ